MADRIIREVTIGAVSVVIKELKVCEIRAWFAGKADLGEKPDFIGLHLFEDLSLADLSVLSDISPDAVDELAPSQLRVLITAIREVNPDFFAMSERLAALGQQILANSLST